MKVNNCRSLSSAEDVNNITKCDFEHFCSIDNSPYCCDYTPPGTQVVDSVSEDSFKWCKDMDGEELQRCSECIGTRSNPTGAIWTELGCIDPSPAGIITRIF